MLPIQMTPRDAEFSARTHLHNPSLLRALAPSFSPSYQRVSAGHRYVTEVTRVGGTDKRLRCLSDPVYVEEGEMRPS